MDLKTNFFKSMLTEVYIDSEQSKNKKVDKAGIKSKRPIFTTEAAKATAMFAKAPPNSCTPLLFLHSLCERCADLEPFAVKKPQDIPVHFLPHPSTTPAQEIKIKMGPKAHF